MSSCLSRPPQVMRSVGQADKMRVRALLIGICILILMFTPSTAKVAGERFEKLVADSGQIVLARVYAVEKRAKNRMVAKAEVLEVWKGPTRQEVLFNASPTWTCDTSDAEVGETAVLFLGIGKPGKLVYISHDGRGRMPVREVDGKSYADFWPEVILPEATPTIHGPWPEYSFIRSVDLILLKNLVVQHTKTDDEE
jgi:hypothetical protein